MSVAFERVQVLFSLRSAETDGERVNGNDSFKRFLTSFLTSVAHVAVTVSMYNIKQLWRKHNLEKWKLWKVQFSRINTRLTASLWNLQLHSFQSDIRGNVFQCCKTKNPLRGLASGNCPFYPSLLIYKYVTGNKMLAFHWKMTFVWETQMKQSNRGELKLNTALTVRAV